MYWIQYMTICRGGGGLMINLDVREGKGDEILKTAWGLKSEC